MEKTPLQLHSSPIKFGTDGWRGIMNDTDFTPENVGIFTQGTLNYLKERGKDYR